MSRCVPSWPAGALLVGVMTLAVAAEGTATLGEAILPAVDFVEPMEQPVGLLVTLALLICAALARSVFTRRRRAIRWRKRAGPSTSGSPTHRRAHACPRRTGRLESARQYAWAGTITHGSGHICACG